MTLGFFVFFFLSVLAVYADKTNNTAVSGSVSWSAPGSWDEGLAPSVTSISGENILINGYVTVSASELAGSGGTMSFAANNDAFNLTVNSGALLVIEGDVDFANLAMNLVINSGGTVLIIGNFSSTNFISVTDDGVLAITGNMAFGGAMSTFTNPGSGNLYVGGVVSGNSTAEGEDQPISNLNDGMGHDDSILYSLIISYDAGITITESTGSTITSEGGTTDDFDVVLAVQPLTDVVIIVSVDDITEYTVDKTSLTFTNSDWSTPQTVIVTGIDDAIDDGDFAGTITLSVDDANSDDAYDPLGDELVSVTNTDNDAFGITVTAISGNTGEDGTTATFTVVLDSEPIANVSIGVSSDDTSEGTVTPASLSFTNTDWFTPQTVTITGVDDDIDDEDVAYNILLAAATSTDPNYNGVDPADVAVTNTDNDAFGITVSAISGNTGEDGTAATFTVMLDSEPIVNVSIGVSSDDTSEGTVSPASLSFSNTDWFTPQTVTITGVDDDIDDGDVAYNILLAAATSTDPNYNGLDPADVAVTNTDNDAFGITVAAISGDTGEDGTSATFTVVLDSEPIANVSIGVSSDDTSEGTVAPTSLSFSNTDWFTPQTVTITGVDDDIDDGDVAYNILLAAATSTDPNYTGLDPADVTVTNTDNDAFGITVTAISGNTSEDGTAATFTFVLDSEPIANVSIGVSSDDTSEGTVAPASLSFSNTDWFTPQTVTITGVDDDIDDGDVAYNILLAAATSTDPNYMGLDPADVAVTNTDNDAFGITVTAISGNTGEDGTTATFTVVLDSEPIANVSIGVSSDDTSEGTVSPTSLSFTNTDWFTPQTVTITGVDDDIDDGDVAYNILLAAATSTDPNYTGLDPADVAVTNTDNDAFGITVSAISGNTGEDGTAATFTVVLDSEPIANVSISVSSDDTSEGTVTPASLSFTNTDWFTPQTVTITGVDDDIDDGDVAYNILFAAATSTDPNYTGLDPADVAVTNTDNDAFGITVTAISGNTGEDGTTATFTVVLDSEPITNVSIGVSSDDTSEGTVSPTSLSFTNTDWFTPQTVTITGVDDDIDDGDVAYNILLAAATSADPNYTGLDPADVAVTNTDNDVFGITVSAISGNTGEDGTTATFTVVLDSEPIANVSIGVSSDDTSEGTVSPASLSFSNTDWFTPQTVTITGVDDDIDDGDVAYNILLAAATSADPNYTGLDPADVAVTNTDNDAFGITVTAISGNTGEDGTTATFTVVLDSEPIANVSIGVSSDDTSEGTVAPTSLSFSNTDWFTPQTVTITGVDDDIDDGDVVYNILLAAATSTDPNYNGVDPADVAVTNTDNDAFGITVTAISGNTNEDGTTATFTVVLDSEPITNVSIGVSSDDTSEGTVAPTSLSFSNTDWFTPQTVTITGLDDDIDDGDVAYNILLAAATSTDPNYTGLDPADVAVTNTDNDAFGITVIAISGNTSEDGTTATFTVVLDSEPIANVSIGVSSDDTSEGTVSPASLSFTNTDWFTPQTVTITGVDDDIDDGDVAYNILLAAATSTDPNYTGIDPADVAVTNTDNDANYVPEITGQAAILTIDEDESLAISLTDLIVVDTDNVYPDDFTLEIQSRENYTIAESTIAPTENYNGQLRISILVNDGVNNSNVFDLLVTILPVNDEPTAEPAFENITFGNVLTGNLLSNASDADGDQLTLTDVTPKIDGFTFTSNGDYTFQNNLTIEEFNLSYEVCDDADPSSCVTSSLVIFVIGGDFDMDGIPDSEELKYNDVDNDGKREYEDLDSDNDEILDSIEAGAFPENPIDTDSDMLPDFVDTDSDDDGKTDQEEGVGDCDGDLIVNYLDSDDTCEDLTIAHAFSPNGDGRNDEWIIPGITEFPNNHVTIFDRRGSKVYEVNGYNNSSVVWRGEVNTGLRTGGNQAMISTYYYVIDLNNGAKPMTGSILLSI